MPLGTIEEELALCREAFKGVSIGALCWCCHHDKLAEELYESPENRIRDILDTKPLNEQALRLHEFRPVESQAAKDI